jgi:hypothetical protein
LAFNESGNSFFGGAAKAPVPDKPCLNLFSNEQRFSFSSNFSTAVFTFAKKRPSLDARWGRGSD